MYILASGEVRSTGLLAFRELSSSSLKKLDPARLPMPEPEEKVLKRFWLRKPVAGMEKRLLLERRSASSPLNGSILEKRVDSRWGERKTEEERSWGVIWKNGARGEDT